MRRVALVILALAVCGALIGIVIAANRGSLRGLTVVKSIPLGDKFAHLVLGAVLSLTVNLAIGVRTVATGRWLLLGTALLVPIVVAEEFSQLWIESRQFDLLDLAMNLLGLLLGDRLAAACSPLKTT